MSKPFPSLGNELSSSSFSESEPSLQEGAALDLSFGSVDGFVSQSESESEDEDEASISSLTAAAVRQATIQVLPPHQPPQAFQVSRQLAAGHGRRSAPKRRQHVAALGADVPGGLQRSWIGRGHAPTSMQSKFHG